MYMFIQTRDRCLFYPYLGTKRTNAELVTSVETVELFALEGCENIK